MADEQEQILDFFKKLLEMSGDGTKVFEMVGKTSAQFEKELKKLNKEVVRGTKSYKDQVDKIKELEEAIEELDESTDAATKSQREEQKAVLLKMRADLQAAASVKGFNEAVRQSTAGMGKQVAQGIGSLIKGLQADSSGTALAADLMSAGVDIAVTGAQGLGKAAQAVAPALSALGPYGIAAGAGLSFLGSIAESSADTIGKLAKFGIEVLSREVEKTYKAFNTMSASGALFTDGMTGMRNAAGGAQLTVEQFSNVVKTSSGDLAQSGLGVTEGARQIGRVGTILKNSGVTNQLLKLGVGFEEQAELTAETVANMRRTAGGMVSDRMVAEQTQKYAENLKLIASITGEDAKKKMDQMREQNAQLAFQQKVANMSTEQRAQLDAAMSTMTEQEAKNFRDRIVFGKVINQEGAIYEATIRGAREKGEEQLRLVQNNALTAEANAELNAQYGEQIKQSALNLTGQARAAYAGIDIVKGPAKAAADAIKQANTYTTDALRQGKINLKGQAGATDDLTQGVVSAEQAAQNLKLALQDTLTPAINDFARTTEAVLTTIEDMLDELGYGSGKVKARKEKQREENLRKAFGPTYGPNATQTEEEAIQKFLEGGGKPGGIYFYKGAPKNYVPKTAPGAAKGDILTGPTSGYAATLHGTEAVVPLPDNRTIPVSLDSSTLTEAVNQQSGILNDILRAMRDNNSLTSGILQHTM